MLNTIRDNAGGPAAKILIGVLVMAFAVWGIADIFRGFGSDVVITAGSTEIPAERFNAEYRQRLNEFSERVGQPISPAEGRQYGIDRRVIAQLAGAAVLSEESRALGLSVSDTMVAADIRSDERFHGAFGKFDRQTFELALNQNQISEAAFVDDRREFMTRDQLLTPVTKGAVMPDGLAEAVYEYRFEQRSVRYLILPPDLVAEIAEPSEEEIVAYHQQAALRFTSPETRSFSVLTVKPEDIVPTIAIDEAVLLEQFETRRDEFDKAETRNVIQVPTTDNEKALEIVSRLRGGEKIEDVLAEIGLSIADVVLNDVTIQNFLSTDIANAAFALSDGEISDPVEGPLGPVVLIVTGINPAVPAKFEDVKDEIKSELVNAEATDAVFDLYNKIEDERAGGATLAELAANLSLELITVENITNQGLTVAGPPPANMPAIPGIVAEVFSNDVGIEIAAGELADEGYYWTEVTSVVPAQLKPLEDVRQDVVELWQREQRKVKLDELAQSVVERGNGGESIDALARSFSRAALTSTPMLRRFSNDTFSRLGVNAIFATPMDKFTYALAGFGDSMIVMQVASISTPEVGNGADGLAEIRDTLTEAASDDLISALVVALQEKYQVEVNTGLIDRILSPGTDG